MLSAHVAAETNRRRQRQEDARSAQQLPLYIEDVARPDWMTPDWMHRDHVSGEDAEDTGRVFREPDWTSNY